MERKRNVKWTRQGSNERREFQRAGRSLETSNRPRSCQNPGAYRSRLDPFHKFRSRNTGEEKRTLRRLRDEAGSRRRQASGGERKSLTESAFTPEAITGSSDEAVPIGAAPGFSSVLHTNAHHRSAMVSVKISPDGKPLSLARGLPVTVTVQGRDNPRVADVKVAIAARFPKVGQFTHFTCHECETEGPLLALRVSSKTHAEGRTKSLGR